MPDDRVLERIASWQAAGLIDAATAERLRSAEAGTDGETEPTVPASVATASGGSGFPSAIGSAFGPTPTIGELFAYLGAGFVLVAWHVLVMSWWPQQYSESTGYPVVDYVRIGLEWLVPIVVLAVIGWLLTGRDERARRAAGVVFAVATGHVYGGLLQVISNDTDFRLSGVVAGAGAAIAALLFRLRHAALLTQATLLVSLAALAAAALGWLGPRVFGQNPFGEVGGDPTLRALASGAWWLAWALGFGLLARREDGSARGTLEDDAPSSSVFRLAALRRASLTRLAAGLTAVGGTAMAMSGTVGVDGQGIPTWLGDVVILLVSGLLIVLAARAASVYLYPAALGVIIALTSLNTVYVAEQTGIGVAFLVEGGILLLAGLSADRLRRWLAARRPEAAPAE